MNLMSYNFSIKLVISNNECSLNCNSPLIHKSTSDGCIIEGEVENSVIFRGVKIGKNARVRNCILMQGTVVGDGAECNYLITDKNVTIGSGHILTSAPTYPMYVAKGAGV